MQIKSTGMIKKSKVGSIACFIILILLQLFSGVHAFARHFKDTVHFRRVAAVNKEIVMSDSALNDLGIDSLLNKVEHAHNTLTEIINTNEIGFDTREIEDNDAELDSNISLIEQNLDLYKNVLDVKNLQMFDVLLKTVNAQLTDWRELLFSYNKNLLAMSSELTAIRNDTLLKEIMEDSVFVHEYSMEIQDIKNKWKEAKKLVGINQARLKICQVNVSNQYFETLDLQNKTKDLLHKIGLNAFGQEFEFLWKASTLSGLEKAETVGLSSRSYKGQQKILGYYFKKKLADQLWILLITALFFTWILRNFIVLKKAELPKGESLTVFRFITPVPVLPAMVVMFSLAPFFDNHPPTAYVQITQLLLVVSLSILMVSNWSRSLLYYWFIIVAFFLAFSITGIVLVPTLGSRLWLLSLNILALIFGLLWLRKLCKVPVAHRNLIRAVSIIFILMNIIAAFANLYGRLSIAKIVSVTSIYSLTQIVGLTIFIQVILEAVRLQTIVNKTKGGLAAKLNFMSMEKLITNMLLLVTFMVWCIVFTVSLNLYNVMYDWLAEFLTKTRKIGTTEFQLGNILVFVTIIYISNLFQQGVGSLYGRGNSAWDPEIKKNASRLAITRLLLIVAGFLMAVAASGLPMDKITIVLGALGVGIGLGLQTIVNNLVSGVILIFEQPFRIGDYIELGDKRGRVLDIGIRSSKIMMEEGAEIIMPNADLLSGRVVNWTLHNDNVRIELAINVMTGHTLEDISKIITDELERNKSVVKSTAPEILLAAVNEKTMNLRVLVWIDDVHKIEMLRSTLLNDISARLEQHSIKIV